MMLYAAIFLMLVGCCYGNPLSLIGLGVTLIAAAVYIYARAFHA